MLVSDAEQSTIYTGQKSVYSMIIWEGLMPNHVANPAYTLAKIIGLSINTYATPQNTALIRSL